MAPKRRAPEVEEPEPSEPEEAVDVDDDEYESAEEQTPAKRQELDMEYKRGTIKKITVHNFMTYSGTVTIRPGPRLNLVLGPNGTGKSSLVCALCVGLAASTKLLGRAENLGDYVRHNATSAYTEITLSGGGGNNRDLVIRRDIKIDDAPVNGQAKRSFTSVCKIDGKTVTKEVLHKAIIDQNIQLDNLCQFLPQDKVVEFAKMQPKELLEATEKALGESTLFNLHEWLKEKGKEIKLQQVEQKRVSDKLTGLQRQQEAQRRDYERVQQQQLLTEKIDLISKKLEWLRVVDAKRELTECKQLWQTAHEQWEARQVEVLEDTAPIKKLEKQVATLEQQLQAAKQAAKRARDVLHAQHKDVEETKGQLDQEEDSIKSLKEKSEQWKATVRKLQLEIQETTAKLLTMPTALPPELLANARELRRRCDEASRSITDLNEQYSDLAGEIRNIQSEGGPIQHELRQLGDPRLQKLKQWDQMPYSRGVLAVYNYMMELKQQNRFKGEVYGPVLLELNMVQEADPSWVDFVENQCRGMFFNFVTSCREDEKLLSDFVKHHNLKLVVNTVNYDYSGPIPHPHGPAQNYQNFGISHTLDEVFDAPHVIKHMLKDLTKINTVYVGNAETKRQSAQLFATTPVKEVYAKQPNEGDVKLSYSVSRYNSNAKTTQVDNVRRSQHLGGGSMAQLDARKQHLQQLLHEIEQRLVAKEGEQREVQAQVQQLQSALQQDEKDLDNIMRRQDKINHDRTAVQMQIETKNKLLTRHQNQPDPLDQQEGILHRIKQLTTSMANTCLEHADKYQAYWTATRKHMVVECELTERNAQVNALKARVEQQTLELRRLETSKRQAEAVVKEAQAKYQRVKQHAERVAPRTAELTEAMKKLDDDPKQLEEEMQRLQREADNISVNDANVVAVYEKRQKDIAAMEQELGDLDQRLVVALGALNEKKEQWLPDLKQLVDEINGGFSTNFKEIGCAGEVVLYEPDDNDFEMYEIRINVKFRPNEEMQQLTANRQSGGERSVSTILYLIALQGVTETPFRVVDEINQGMDPINERKVFTLLVESSCKPDTPQCFLLTPKLLPGLPFKHEITLLMIQNGNLIDRPVIDTYDQCAKSGDMLSSLLGARWRPQQQQQLAVAQ